MKLNRNSSGIVTMAVLVIVALVCLASLAAAQTPPQVWIDRQVPKDTVVQVTPNERKPLLFGFDSAVVRAAGLPNTAPARSYCTVVRSAQEVVFVDSVVERAEAELPACEAHLVPLVIRPVCNLTPSEHILWVVQKLRPVILFCGATSDPKVFLLGTGGQSA
jgi:hypothetical protein